MDETAGDDRDDPRHDLVRVFRRLCVVAGTAATLPVLASLVLRQVAVASPRLVAYVAATPAIVVAGVAAVVVLLIGGSHTGTAVAAVATVLLGLTQVPLYLGSAGRPAEDAGTFTIMTVNLHFGVGDLRQVLEVADARDVDVLATEELPLFGVRAMLDAGPSELFPHRITNGLRGASGNALWSRRPLSELPVPGGIEHAPLAASVDVGGTHLFVACVHPVSPYPDGAHQWSAEMGRLADWLAGVEGAAVVAGDFNATSDHRQFRDILAAGLEDAAMQVGAGWLPTFPANRRRIPLLVTIDHVLASDGIVATDVERVDIAGTDHAALVVRLAVPAVV